ncbi:MAG: hypothetical protein WCS88_01605 [Patescibacteria group bacterium]|jgi:Tfp pilus assembly protein FimT
MFKKIFFVKQLDSSIKSKVGFTIIELLLVVAVTAIITVVSVAYIKGDDTDDVDLAAGQLLSDVRELRSLAASHQAFDFDGPIGIQPAVYPAGGYGITFSGGNSYRLFADSGATAGYDAADGTIRVVTLDNTSLHVEGLQSSGTSGGETKYFTFKSENDASTNLVANAAGRYEMAIIYSDITPAYVGKLSLGENSTDGSIIVSLGVGFASVEIACAELGASCGGSIECCGVLDTCNPVTHKCTAPTPPPGGGTILSCFPAGTKILMADNSSKNIEDVQIGDFVLSYDEKLGVEVVAEVLELAAPVREHMCEITFADDDSLKLTNEHPVYTTDGWKSINPEETYKENDDFVVERLLLGDEVFFVNELYKVVKGINCWQEEGIQTYNLKSVKDSSTFFADDILVHNVANPDCGTPATRDPAAAAGALN